MTTENVNECMQQKYSSGYVKPKPIEEQLAIVEKLFHISVKNFRHDSVSDMRCPVGAEGYFVIPIWSRITTTYPRAVMEVQRLLWHHHPNPFSTLKQINATGINSVKQTKDSSEAWKKLDARRFDDEGYLTVIPAQFGGRYQGEHIEHVRSRLEGHEFCLGAFAVGIMLLTHLDRLRSYADLRVDCAGDSWNDPPDKSVDDITYIPAYDLNVLCGLSFRKRSVFETDWDFGVVTGWLS